jgi:hypothetical protein
MGGWYRACTFAALAAAPASPFTSSRYVDRTPVENTPSMTSGGDGCSAPLLGGFVHPLVMPAQAGGVMPKALPYLKKVWGI